jgi:hypothetical protein
MIAYRDIVPEEFDFRLEARKIETAARLFRETGLDRYVAAPTVRGDLSSERVLALEWMRGPSLLDVFRGRSGNAPPALPGPQKRTFGSWAALYAALHKAWGAQIFRLGEFHTDPHPGNLILMEDGRVGILDWGQTKRLDAKRVDACAACACAMAAGDVPALVDAIETSGDFVLKNPSPLAWALIAYTYFDTRWTPLAGVNLYDVDRSLLAKDGFERNSPEVFPLIRIAFLFRGAEAVCGVLDESMVDAWERDALRRLNRTALLAAPRAACRGARRRAAASLARSLPPSLVRRFSPAAARLAIAQRETAARPTEYT